MPLRLFSVVTVLAFEHEYGYILGRKAIFFRMAKSTVLRQMTISEIQKKLRNNEFEISLHAFEEAVDDFLSLNEVIRAILQNGEIVEENPDDFRCLVHCTSKRQHIHVAFDYYEILKGLGQKIEIVTIYKPDPALWINYRKRKR